LNSVFDGRMKVIGSSPLLEGLDTFSFRELDFDSRLKGYDRSEAK